MDSRLGTEWELVIGQMGPCRLDGGSRKTFFHFQIVQRASFSTLSLLTHSSLVQNPVQLLLRLKIYSTVSHRSPY